MKTPALKILIIDDDLIDQNILIMALQKNFDPVEIQTQSKLHYTISEKYVSELRGYDLIFFDYQLPSGVASEQIHLLKKHWNLKTPIVLLTGMKSDILKDNIEVYENVFFEHKEKEFYEKVREKLESLKIFEPIPSNTAIKK